MPLFNIIKFYCFDEKCRIYLENEDDLQFEGFVIDIPYWLCNCKIIEGYGIGVEDGILYFYVEE